MPMTRKKLTKAVVMALPAPSEGFADYFDVGLRGFHVRVFASGKRSYRLKYTAGGRQRVATIGEHGPSWTTEQARTEAEDLRMVADRGRDPIAERMAAAHAAAEKERRTITVEQLVEKWLAEGRAANPSKRESSWSTDARKLRRHIVPLIGPISVQVLTKGDIESAQARIVAGDTKLDEKTKPRGRAIVRGGRGAARGAVMSLSACLSWAVDQEIIASNPAIRVRKEKPRRRERFLSEQEAGRFLDTLTAMEREKKLNSCFADMLRVLLLTGARKSEIQALHWSEVDLARLNIVLPRERSKTGEKVIPINAATAAILTKRKSRKDFVFPSPFDAKRPAEGLQKAWERVRVRAKLTGVRIHDLRHSFASFAVASGASLPLIAKALGHTQTSMTERYAHLGDDPVRTLSERVSKRLVGLRRQRKV
ncbi:integrase [alpha proteobacterium U9-1i]|nr:integrase [alpha proteobacterium U9-1i]